MKTRLEQLRSDIYNAIEAKVKNSGGNIDVFNYGFTTPECECEYIDKIIIREGILYYYIHSNEFKFWGLDTDTMYNIYGWICN